MTDRKIPILLSFYALQGENGTLLFGQLTYTGISDLSFKDYNRRKTFRTLVRLYRTRPYADQKIVLHFDKATVYMRTDASGAFYGKASHDLGDAVLRKIVLSTGQEVKLLTGLYSLKVNKVQGNVIVISDIDDTLMHSFIYRKMQKFRTLMFTAVEKRRAVFQMQEVIKKLVNDGAVPFYLSNSEQNLYPLIYRFLSHNNFPEGPLFLKKMRKLWDVFFSIKFPIRNFHKEQMLVDILSLFPSKKFILIGDNTQYDLSIYLQAAEKYADNVRYILIRKVVPKNADVNLIEKSKNFLKEKNINLYYEEEFPYSFRF